MQENSLVSLVGKRGCFFKLNDSCMPVYIFQIEKRRIVPNNPSVPCIIHRHQHTEKTDTTTIYSVFISE